MEHDSDEAFPPATDRRPGRPPRHPPLDEATVAAVRSAAREYVVRDFPDASSELREQYVEQVVQGIRWLQIVWGPDKECPYCTNRAWTVGVPVQILNGGVAGASGEGRSYIADDLGRVFPVTCTSCGQTVFVSESYAQRADAES